MKTSLFFRSLPALVLASLLLSVAGFGQSAPRKMYAEAYYHKLKPGHTFAEARAIENEFKKVHQGQADDGSIGGWYMLAVETSTNPSHDYDYITIKTVPGTDYFDNAYPEAALKKGWGTEYQAKMADLSKRMVEVKTVVRAEYWEVLEGAIASSQSAPGRLWVMSSIKMKRQQADDVSNYLSHTKQMKSVFQEEANRGGSVAWTFAAPVLPWSTESRADFMSVFEFANMKTMLEHFSASDDADFKKALPNVDMKKFYQELGDLREAARQEIGYLVEYAAKTPAVSAKK